MRPEETPFICVRSAYIPENKKTVSHFQMQAMAEAKRREINFGTHHKLVTDQKK